MNLADGYQFWEQHAVPTGRFIMFSVITNIHNKTRIIAAVKNIDAPISTRVWQELEYRIDVCRVTRGAHIEHL
jgi:hypothetical protein